MRPPTVTVLMSVFNGARYLESAVRSILDQTFRDFEFVIINDGSTDNSPDLLERFDDPRIRVIHTVNGGLAAALARGVDEARGDYIARMDADDLALPERLETQVAYLQQHPDVGVADSDYAQIGPDDTELGVVVGRGFDEPFLIAWKLLWENGICHPAVMMRRDVLTGHNINYAPDSVVEDYDLWTRMMFRTRFAHIPAVLLKYRSLSTGMTGSRDARQLYATSQIQHRTVSTLLGRTLDPAVGHSMALLSQQTTVRPGPEDILDTGALLEIVEDVRRTFAASFGLSPSEQSRVDAELARRLLDWALVLARLPGRENGGTGMLMKRALTLDYSVVLDRRFSRNLLVRAFDRVRRDRP